MPRKIRTQKMSDEVEDGLKQGPSSTNVSSKKQELKTRLQKPQSTAEDGVTESRVDNGEPEPKKSIRRTKNRVLNDESTSVAGVPEVCVDDDELQGSSPVKRARQSRKVQPTEACLQGSKGRGVTKTGRGKKAGGAAIGRKLKSDGLQSISENLEETSLSRTRQLSLHSDSERKEMNAGDSGITKEVKSGNVGSENETGSGMCDTESRKTTEQGKSVSKMESTMTKDGTDNEEKKSTDNGEKKSTDSGEKKSTESRKKMLGGVKCSAENTEKKARKYGRQKRDRKHVTETDEQATGSELTVERSGAHGEVHASGNTLFSDEGERGCGSDADDLQTELSATFTYPQATDASNGNQESSTIKKHHVKVRRTYFVSDACSEVKEQQDAEDEERILNSAKNTDNDMDQGEGIEAEIEQVAENKYTEERENVKEVGDATVGSDDGLIKIPQHKVKLEQVKCDEFSGDTSKSSEDNEIEVKAALECQQQTVADPPKSRKSRKGRQSKKDLGKEVDPLDVPEGHQNGQAVKKKKEDQSLSGSVDVVKKRVPVKKIPVADLELKMKMLKKMGARDKKYIGAHVSISGGLWNAVSDAVLLGARAFGMFLKSQRQWISKPLDEENAELFKTLLKEYGFSPSMVIPHGSYLMNCGSPREEILQKSRVMLLDELKRCEMLGLDLFNFHPGSTCGKISAEESISLIAESINMALEQTNHVTAVIETMCGQGNTIGGKFAELAQVIEKVKDKSRIGVCLDTCHIFAAGYDIKSEAGYEKTMNEFNEVIGFKYLKAVHLNDSKEKLGGHRDLHANIGEGKIGTAAFKRLMNDRRFDNIPMILETPQEDYSTEIRLLNNLMD